MPPQGTHDSQPGQTSAATTATPLETASPGPSTPVPVTRPRGRVGATELGYIFAATGAILFSTKGVAIKLAYVEGLDAETVLALRMAFALPIYAAIGLLAVAGRRRRGEALPGRGLVIRAGIVGLLGYWFASYTDFLGLEYISAQFERLILFTYPLFVVLLGAAFFGHKLRIRSLFAIGVSYAGLVLIFSEKFGAIGTDIAIGGGFVVLAALAFAFYQLFAKSIITEMGPRLFTCVAMSGAAMGAFMTFAFTHPIADAAVSPRALSLLVFIAIGATVLPSFFLSAALYRISAQANAAIGTLSPVATIIMAVFILGEHLSWIDIAGTALVLAGVGWFTLGDHRAAKSG